MIFTKKDLENFLIALDGELNSKHEIIIIGGAAAALHYDSKRGTVDIDTYNSIEELKEAYRKTLKRYPALRIPLSASLPAKGPANMKARLERHTSIPLTNLTVLIPEAHDWVLLKTARCEEKDIADIKELKKRISLKAQILLARFKNEVFPFNPGNDEDSKAGYLYMISVIYDEPTAQQHEASLKGLS